MIDYQLLRRFVLEALKANPSTEFSFIISETERIAAERNVFPTEKECKELSISYHDYRGKKLNPIDKMNVNQIIWDFITERVLTMGKDRINDEWPFLRLTEFGQLVAEEAGPTHYDPDGYIATLERFAPKLDPVIKQYVLEGLNSFRQRLFFAAAVMFGAAAEKAVLLLLELIGNAQTDKERKSDIHQLLERPNLPKIISTIQSQLNSLIKGNKIPYSVHQSSSEHLLSLFEMIRVQRNDAVHPAAGQVNRTKAFIIIQTLPVALEVLYRLIEWFRQNKI